MAFWNKDKKMEKGRSTDSVSKSEVSAASAEPKSQVKRSASPDIKDTRDAFKVLVRPLVSEKMARKTESRQYGFIVMKTATKQEIRKAVESVYGVHVVSVNTSVVPGKSVRFSGIQGRRSAWKKAYVTVKSGEKIELFEQV